MDDSWEELSGEGRTAKDLFKLIVRKGAVRVSDAPKLMGVERGQVDEWARTLIEKKYALAEGEGADQTLKPTDEMLNRISGYRERFPEGLREGYVVANELTRERELRLAAEEQASHKDTIIDGLRAELVQEQKTRHGLEERLGSLGIAESTPGRMSDLEAQLLRERAERGRLEEIMRRKDMELDALRGGMPQAPAPEGIMRQLQPQKRAPDQAARPVEPAAKTVIVEPKAPEKPQGSQASWFKSGADEKKEEEAPAAAPSESVAHEGENDASSLLSLLAQKKTLSFKDACHELAMGEPKLQECVAELQGYGAVTAGKRLFGGAEVTLKKDADVEAILDKIRARKVREEMRRLRGA